MELLADLAARSLLLFGIVLFSCQLLAQRLGFAAGTRSRASGRGESADGVGLVVTSLMGLLAFTLALTLSFATSKYTERRAGVLTEANAIGTAWLRAGAIGHPLGVEIAELLKQYGQLRREYVRAPRGSAMIEEVNGRTDALQSKIWDRLSSIVRERPDAISSALMVSLNEAFDASTAERFAIETTMPHQLFWLLVWMTMVGIAAFGYQLGLRGYELRVLLVLLVAVWTTVLVVILDLSAPRIGATRTASSVYDWTLETMVRKRAMSSSSASR